MDFTTDTAAARVVVLPPLVLLAVFAGGVDGYFCRPPNPTRLSPDFAPHEQRYDWQGAKLSKAREQVVGVR